MANLPAKYALFNNLQTKNVCVVVEIEGADPLSNRPLYTRIRYGDPGLKYGQTGVVYGGLRLADGIRDILSLDGSSLTISQKLEPEQGRSSVSQMGFAFIDKDQYITQLVSPGIIVDEILGRNVVVRLGYQEISYPDDYYVIFRGKISSIGYGSGLYTISLSDPNIDRRQQVFFTGKSQLVGSINSSVTTINVLDNADFYKHNLGPDGLYDVPVPWNQDGTHNVLATRTTGVRTFFKIDDEWIEYGPLGYATNSFVNVLRGARGSLAAAHASAADVEAAIEIRDHAIDIALKLMLSRGEPYRNDVIIYSIVQTLDGTLLAQDNTVLTPPFIDAIEDLGLTEGDWITISGAINPTNNNTFQIVRFADVSDQSNRLIYLTGPVDLIAEFPTTAVMSLRSQFDTYPELAGIGMDAVYVDVRGHIDLKDQYLSDDANRMRFFVTSPSNCKSFVENENYLPTSSYSITRRGKLSIGYTKPPIATSSLVFLSKDNLIDVQNLRQERATNNRKFFNEIDWNWDFDDNGNSHSSAKFLDVDSLSLVGISSVLPITSSGSRTDLGSNTLFDRRSRFLLSRYKRGAMVIKGVKTFYGLGNQIEAGDVIALVDEGTLNLLNIQTGKRDLGTQLFEVTDRSFDIKSGFTTLELTAGISTDITDRFATISPSSRIVSGTSTYIIIQDSYGSLFPGNESKKWKDYLNIPVVFHDENYTYYQQTTLTSISTSNNFKIFYSGLAVPPSDFSQLVIDIPYYPDTTDKNELSIYKQIHGFFTPRVAITSGTSNFSFNVGSGDVAKFFVGSRAIVATDNFSSTSSETTVTDITGTLISVKDDLGFTPDNTYFVTCIGFPDKTGPYRIF